MQSKLKPSEQSEGNCWPLGCIRIVTILKVVNSNFYLHHEDDSRYQIDCDGFVLDSLGNAAFAELVLDCDKNDLEKLICLQNQYSKGSLHYLKSGCFSFDLGIIQFLSFNTKPVNSSEFDKLNDCFPFHVSPDEENDESDFYYCGMWFRSNNGRINLKNRFMERFNRKQIGIMPM